MGCRGIDVFGRFAIALDRARCTRDIGEGSDAFKTRRIAFARKQNLSREAD